MNQNYDVFISYRRRDGTALARAVRDYLTKRGLRVVFKKASNKPRMVMKKPRFAEVWQGAVNHQYVVLRLCQHNQSYLCTLSPLS